MMRITTISQLGARRSIAQWHVAALQRAQPDADVNHVLYIVDPRNTLLADWARGLGAPFTVYDKTQNDWTDFTLRSGSAFGGDSNYDFLIRRPEVGDLFLTLHDDSILRDSGVWARLRAWADEYHFGGYLDTRGVPQYDHLYFDGIPVSSLRIGTWFCFGRTRHYLDRGYTIGDYRTYFKWAVNWKYRTRRITADGWKVWLNGGFDLNLRARLRGDRFCIIDEKPDTPVLAEHWNKITGFFVKRGLLDFADAPDEVERWEQYLTSLAGRDPAQFTFDLEFLGRIAAELESAGIADPLLNTDRLRAFKALGGATAMGEK